MPAVSMSFTVPSSVSIRVSMASRVVLSRETVEQGRLADVRSPDDRHRRHGGAGFARARALECLARGWLGQQADHVVEQVPDPAPVQRAHHGRLAEAEPGKLPGIDLALFRVDFVGNDDHLAPVTTDELTDGGILAG
jgi:hypothetical protein